MLCSVVEVVVLGVVLVVVVDVVVDVVLLVVVVLVKSTRGGMVGRRLKGRLLPPPLGLRAVLMRDGPRKPGTLGLY